ncbi:trans-sialidase [Trypanosoma cruzi cruzi]|uniref:Putative trans-sialidase, Group V n=1 Tax=Trypanosoma cruzi TaxID=5693 RepID=A0A2V2W0L0_TRYCR|nr:trans-sialidase [Trypanosoma cruzi cruzi]PWV01019.1 putative trans-sialidase, Group V [Trypanosoma cruzi]
MLSRAAAVMAFRTHNRRRVTGSSGRREGGESERQRPDMSRRVFTSAVLLLVVMMWCGTGVAKAEEPSSGPKFEWKDITEEGVTVDSLGVPGLLKVGSDVFAVAEAQCKKGENRFTGIASKLLTLSDEPSKEEFDATQVKTQVLVECSSDDVKAGCHVAVEGSGSPNEKIVDVSRPTAVVNGSDIYMLVGKYCREDAADTCKATSEKFKSGILLVKGTISESGNNNKIHWKKTDGVPCTLGEQQKTLTGLIGGGGSGVKMKDGKLVFPVEATKNEADAEEGGKTVSLIIYSSDTSSCTLSKEVPADGCGVPSVVEWKDKLMMMTACDDGRRRVYEIGDKGESWTEALGTLSRVWGNKQKGGKVKIVGSGLITATLGNDGDKRNVMLVTLPVYAKEKEKGVLRLWLTDNTHIVDIGSVSGEAEDVAASSLLYKSGDNNEELIALYEKKKGESSNSMVSVLLTEQLKRVKNVLATWKEVDKRVSKLCPSEGATEDTSSDTACTTDKVTDGLVGFLSGNFSDNTWRDEYLGVNATVNNEKGSASTENGVTFTGSGAWAEWPVGKQGENQLYHFANYNFTLVATVSIHKVPKEGSIPLMGAKMDGDGEKTVLFGLSYNDKENKWILLCGGGENKKYSSHWEPDTAHQVAIVLQNGTQGSAYVDGQRVGTEECNLENTDSKGISHFYIGGDGGSAEGREEVPVTVSNVLLYNRPWTSEEIAGLAKKKITIPKPEGPTTLVVNARSPTVSAPDVERTVTQSPPSGPRQMKQETLNANIGGGAGGLSSAASVNTTPSSDVAQTVVTVGGDKMQRNGSPQTPEVSMSSAEDAETVEGTDLQEEEVQPQDGEVNATALNSSLGKLSQGNNSDAGTVRGIGLLSSLLLLLLGLWGFAAL